MKELIVIFVRIMSAVCIGLGLGRVSGSLILFTKYKIKKEKNHEERLKEQLKDIGIGLIVASIGAILYVMVH